MATTNNLGMTLVEQSQSQKEVTVNAALTIIDAILNVGALDKDLATPPGSPAEGDIYIVAASATGDWAGQDGDLTYFINGAWAFLDPSEGFTIWVNDEDKHYTFDGTNWVSNATLGVNATADATNKLAVASSAILFSHIGAGCQIKVNKNAAGDTGSYLFQTGFSGRAEFGLIGNDDFTLKVSPDGSTWYDSFVVDDGTGNIDFKQEVSFSGTTTAGLTVKSLTTTERNALTAGAGMVILNTTTGNFEGYDGSSWVTL